ncbi:variable surface protein [Plasmodium gonderi]|uniref:Variable surface protein n=1 Tax=Plasmodium gonderi TaxID=77519 RepID=A0A1Y1JV82_PLAGO|nr:variable surface protein [Plasmodium gonderi]GAW84652.1 variable surface protein [Plasmodium gonderi]
MNYYIFKKMKNKYIFSKIFILIALTWNYKLHDLYTIGETCNETIYVNGTFGIRNKRLLTDQKIGEGLKNPRLDENSWDKSGKKKLKNVSEPYSTMKELKLQKHRRNGAEKNYAKNKSPLKLLFKKSNLNCKEKVIAAYNYIRNFKQHIDWDKHRIRTKQFLRSIELFISVLSLVSFDKFLFVI